MFVPPHFKPFFWKYQACRLRLLDVGCGAHAPSKAKKYFPLCEYHGVDLDDKALDPADQASLTRFYALDLDQDPLDQIPSEYFDVIIISHVIEHLLHGLEAVASLAQKLRPGGYIYIEFPGVRSLNVPHARHGFLHFHDDPTHVRLYTVPEVVNVLLEHQCTIIKAGVRRDLARLLLTPLLLGRGLLQQGDIWSGRPWDLFGIAELIYAQKAKSVDQDPPPRSGLGASKE
jgi:SAM-dependent methyltransferase